MNLFNNGCAVDGTASTINPLGLMVNKILSPPSIFAINKRKDIQKSNEILNKIWLEKEQEKQLILASIEGNIKIIKKILEDPRIDPSMHNNCALRMASENGHLEVVDRLLKDERVDPRSDSHYAIRYASKNGHVKVVDRLMKDSRTDAWEHNNDALNLAMKYNHNDVVNRLLKDPSVRCHYKHDESFIFIKEGKEGRGDNALKNIENGNFGLYINNNELIRIASEYGSIEVVNYLLDKSLMHYSVDPGAVDNYSIKMASKNGHIDVVKSLLKDDRVDPSANDNHALRLALENGHTEIVKLLKLDPRVDRKINSKL